jgi:uncharacterized protein YndB with AHSA1/START domain
MYTRRSVIHGSFVLEQGLAHSPGAVFEAYAQAARVRRWRIQGEGWNISEFSYDFRIGGTETSRLSFRDGPECRLQGVFHDIVPATRLVAAYKMAVESAPFWVALWTIELFPFGGGTLLRHTEQGAYFTGADAIREREAACRAGLERLAQELGAGARPG